jgi:hypothetical protein
MYLLSCLGWGLPFAFACEGGGGGEARDGGDGPSTPPACVSKPERVIGGDYGGVGLPFVFACEGGGGGEAKDGGDGPSTERAIGGVYGERGPPFRVRV